MAELTEKETDYNSGSSDSESQHNHIFERPTGLRGFYSHPLTQVILAVCCDVFLGLTHPFQQVSMLGFVCFMCPGSLA
jgi:hypothetical protein